MERDGDLMLNVSCSRQTHQANDKLPQRMPDGTRIDRSRNLTKKIIKTHHPATSSGTVFIPKHKLPCLDEFGLSIPNDRDNIPKERKVVPLNEKKVTPSNKRDVSTLNEKQVSPSNEKAASSNSQHEKRRKRKKKEEEPKIIPKEVRMVAGGLPPSFPQHRLKKFTEEYQLKRKRELEDGEAGEEEQKKRRRSFVPGLNPRKREKAPGLFTDTTLQDLEDVHPYLIQNLEQNFSVGNLTKIQSLLMPYLLKTRFDQRRHDIIVNSGIGTGKILAYVAPIVNNLALMEPRISRTDGIYALVLLPTRDLAAKVSEIFSKLCQSFLWVVPGLLTGGERKKSEKARLRKGLNILITTPGRLIDHMDHSMKLDFTKLRYCIMADAHRLLDPERVEVSKNIAIMLRKRLPHNCIRCMVTATMTKKLEKFSEIFVTKPVVMDAFKEFE